MVDKLLHAPTVRVKQLASVPGGAGYADALRELFELDPQTTAVLGAPQADDGRTGATVAQAQKRDRAPRDGEDR